MSARYFLTFTSFAGIVVLVAAASHANAPSGRYTFPSPGVVFDNETKLTWQQSMTGGSNLTLANATTNCSNLSLSGGSWRLPTIKELQTIIDYSQAGGPTAMLDSLAFPSAPTSYEWAITPDANSPGGGGYAWVVMFVNGLARPYNGTATAAARCVR